MRNKLITLTATSLILILVASLTACTKSVPSVQTTPPPAQPSNTSAARPAPFGSIPARQGGPGKVSTPPVPQAIAIKGSGTIGVSTYANLYFGSAGQIAQINVKLGDYITKGTVLAKLDTTSLEALLAQAQVNLTRPNWLKLKLNQISPPLNSTWIKLKPSAISKM